MNTREIMKIALCAGDILLKSGAETSRVEDTVRRICRCYDVECECFVMPTGIFISTIDTNTIEDSISCMKRVSKHSVDLHRIELVNSFSRYLENHKISYGEAFAKLKEINSTPHFSFRVRLLCAGTTAFAYSLLFKGTVRDGIVAFVICLLMYILKEYISKTGYLQMFESFGCSVIAGIFSILFYKLIPGLNLDSIIAGSIMILVPGLVITSGIKDAIHGDMVSCTSRIAEALFVVTSVGAGIALVLTFAIHIL